MNTRLSPRASRLGLALSMLLAAAAPLQAAESQAGASDGRSGRDVYERFRSGLAEPNCPAQDNRWAKQYAHAPTRLASRGDETLVLFGHVVDSLRAAQLPTEYALIPFVESGYKPTARSPAGPAGLWQFIATTARNHKVPIRAGYDGRLSPVDSTKAAVRYLKTLHGMFGGNWRLAVMAYNAGEYRVLGALRRSGQSPRDARPESLTGLPEITRVYDDKLHAISCVIAQADDQPQWLAALDRPVRALAPVTTADAMIATAPPKDATAGTTGLLAALAPPVVADRSGAATLGAPAGSAAGAAPPAAALETTVTPSAVTAVEAVTTTPRRHTVTAGESLWRIARRYRVPVSDLLSLNGLDAGRALVPGLVLAIDALPGARK